MQAVAVVSEGLCPVCCTQHDLPAGCPGELRPTGAERHGWAVAVDAPRGVELYGVVVAPSGSLWRARVVTYPHAPWMVPGGRATIKFAGSTPGEAEAKALQFVLRWCAERGRNPRDGFGPWDLADGGGSRRPPPRTRRTLPVRYGADGLLTLTTTSNLSTGGMFLTSTDPVGAGTTLEIEMEIFECLASMRGAVVWRRVRLEPGRPRGMGVRLFEPPPVYKLFVRSLR